MLCDLRSDTLTKPSRDMLQHAILSDQGDDCFGESRSVFELEEHCADMFGKEAALLLPSGTMSNQIALRVIAQPGDEIICDSSYHINFFEAAQSSAISGVSLNIVGSADGVLRCQDLESAIAKRARWSSTYATAKAIWLENTINGKNGRPLSLDELRSAKSWAANQEIFTYMDGARVLNAAISEGLELHEIAVHCDSLSMCFAKGLGAPMGSVLVGSKDFIAASKRYRKWLGGGLHQSGFIAAAALFALRHNKEQLERDHSNAKQFAKRLNENPNFSVDLPRTNIVMFDVGSLDVCPVELVSQLDSLGVRVLIWKNTTLRAVFSSLLDSRLTIHAADTIANTTANLCVSGKKLYA